MAIQKKEYELSIWHEFLNSTGKAEEKLAVIGAHDMTYLGRATNVKLQTKINGTHTLTFQMPDKWFDSESGEFVLNEFKDYVVNENKVKLYYKNKWLEFFIKNSKLTKHYKSYMYEYSCSDAFIDELARNGYGITFDTDLYNNVEEIGTFSEEILDGSLWEYTPEYNWGDFTEFLEEKLFKIPVNLFNELSGYKLHFDIPNTDEEIVNINNYTVRPLEMGDDLARVKSYYWDNHSKDNGFKLLSDPVSDIPNDGYIYVPYSLLDFCYIKKESFDYYATEEPATTPEGKYYIAPASINPNTLIQFIAIPENGEVLIDESGLILNKNYTYVMTIEQWNKNINSNLWYIFEDKPKQIYNAAAGRDEVIDNPLFFGNKCLLYDGYLDMINDIEVENGKKFSITDRTEVNISDEIDLYVTVYNNESGEFESMYSNDEWQGNLDGYRVCSKISTRLIVPQLARNYFENSVNIQSTDGWELMTSDDEASITIEGWDNNNENEISLTYLLFKPSTNSNTIINFGAVGQEKTIEKDKIYCFGIISDTNYTPNNDNPEDNIWFKIGEGNVNSQGNYDIADKQIGFKPVLNHFYLIKSTINVNNPYLTISLPSRVKELQIKEIWFFEAYTKGLDLFEDGYYRYSGRDIFSKDFLSTNYNCSYKRFDTKEDCYLLVIFENDVSAGDTYGYLQYFILQLKLKDNTVYDTFGHKAYTSADKYADDDLPLNAAQYNEDDYEIITNYIDLNKCSHYMGNTSSEECDCNFGEKNRICMYLKYGYCPYMFTTEKHCRRVRTLTGEKSNRFNLTQEVGKVFEVYPLYYIEHNPNGTIKIDQTSGRAVKQLFYITENGKENKIGFRYEKNLADIGKTINSDQIVTKLYVEDVDSDLSKTGLCSIKTAEDNPSKDSFIIDFSYYIKLGMLDKDLTMADLYGTDKDNLGFLKKLGYYNGEYDKLSNKIINLQKASYTELNANVDVNLTGIETAMKELAKIDRQMTKYYNGETGAELSDTYKNYVEKRKRLLNILVGLIRDTLYDEEGRCIDPSTGEVTESDEIKPLDYFSTATTFSEFKENWVKTHKYTDCGMLGLYCTQYNQIQNWIKERAAYLKEINDLSDKFFKQYEPYLKEGTWSDSNYLTDNAYYHDAVAVAAEGAIPKVTYDIKVTPLDILDEDYEFEIADTTYVEDIGMFGVSLKTGLPNRLKTIISEINENLDKPTENSISVLNYTTLFEDLFLLVTASVLSLSFNENIYKRASNFTSTLNVKADSLLGTLDTNSLTLLDTDESNIKLDAEGLSGSDINNHNNKYKLNGLGLFFSNNGGVTWNVGVGPSGINADYIKVGTLDASKVRIVDGSYVYFLWDKGGISAYRNLTGEDFARFNKYGLSLVEGNLIRLRAGYEFNGTYGKIGSETDDLNRRDIGFYLYDENGNTIFSTESGDNSAKISLAGEIYATSTISNENTTEELTENITGEQTGDTGVFIYNAGKYQLHVEPNVFKRLFSILLRRSDTEQEGKFNNILSVLDNGTLYIGSTAKAYTKDLLGLKETKELGKLGEFLLIDENNALCIMLSNGHIYFGGLDLEAEINRRIDEVEREARDKGLISHTHSIPNLNIETKTRDENYSTYQMKVGIELANNWTGDPIPAFGPTNLTDLTTILATLNFSDLSNTWIAICNNFINKVEGTPPKIGSVNINWIKLSDFVKLLQTIISTTGNAGDNSGSGDVPIDGYYFELPLTGGE